MSLSKFAFAPIDDRVYGLVRIVFASIVLLNLCDLWEYRVTLFSEEGILDSDPNKFWIYSAFHVVRSSAAVTAYFVFSAVMMLLLGLGVVPRFAALCVFVWQVSYDHHLGFASYGADSVMRVYSFLVLISPLGASWSLPHWLKHRNAEAKLRLSPQFGIWLMRLQLVVIYVDTVIVKLVNEFWWKGEVFAYYMLSIYSRWKDPVVADWMWISWLGTYGALVLEFFLPILLLAPKTRVVGIVSGIMLHVMIAVTSENLLLFSLAMIPGYLAFLDGQKIDKVVGFFSRLKETRDQ